MSKINTKETKPRQSNKAKTVENIKYESILSQLVLWFHLWGFITLEN